MVYRTPPRVAKRKDAHRRRLLRVAIRMFGRLGYHATTVPEIVAKSGSSTGSFYFYFRNKEDIFAAALESLGERISQALNEAIAAATPDPLAQMKAAIKRLVSFLAENPEESRILIVESSGLGKRLEKIRREIVASHSRGVEDAIRAISDRLPPIDPVTAARCWVGAVYESVYNWLEQEPSKRQPPEAVAEAVAQFNLRGIGAPSEVL